MGNTLALLEEVKSFEAKHRALELLLNGDESLARREFETLPGFVGALENIVYSSWSQGMGITQTQADKLSKLKTAFADIYARVVEEKKLVESLEAKAEALKMPATYGRLPLYEK